MSRAADGHEQHVRGVVDFDDHLVQLHLFHVARSAADLDLHVAEPLAARVRAG
jgi:hypothetical protein